MRSRHRIPTIFNLSMVDVLCCALGCVILLWLVNFHETKRQAQAASKTDKQLETKKAELTKLRAAQAAAEAQLAQLNRSRSQAEDRAKSLAREISDRDRKLTAADQELADLLNTMAGLE